MTTLTNVIQIIRTAATHTKHLSSIWSTCLLVLAVLIGIELIQHGQTILGSYFLLEQLGHKLAQADKGGEADHIIHITSHH